MTRVLDYHYLDFSHFPRPQILPKYKYELNFIKAYTDFFVFQTNTLNALLKLLQAHNYLKEQYKNTY